MVDDRLEQKAGYLFIASTPAFEFPAATPLPTLTPTPSPTAKPPSLPPIRLSIPKINLNTSIQEISPIEEVTASGETKLMWGPVPADAAGRYDSSGKPGDGRNIVLLGHNNTLGEVFRYLDRLNPGDEVILFTEQQEFHYRIQKKYLIPYLGAEQEGDRKLRSFAAPQSEEMLTMISCWPYATNANRIVLIAVRADDGDPHGN
jgi:LPXTG-site transpeptidase (sortase) family protein